ncbi:ABC transporter substrate-binding protein [Aeromonas sp. AE23HZ002T15]
MTRRYRHAAWCTLALVAGISSAHGKPLSMVGPWEIHSLDPASNGVFFTRLQVAETLVEVDGKGRLLPGLAGAWSVSEDGLQWRFTLRPQAHFHDGTEVSVEQVAWALQQARGKPGVLQSAPIAMMEARDGALLVTLHEPFAPLAAVLAHPSTQILARAAYDDRGKVIRVIGSGPYQIARLQQPQRVETIRFDGWDGPKPAIEQVSYLTVGRAESRTLMAESGQADIAWGLDPVSIRRLQQAPRVTIASVTLPRTIQLKLNGADPRLSEPAVRRALSLATDRVGMATALLRDPEMAATQLFPPSLREWHQPGLSPLVYDVKAAQAAFAAAGWQLGSDGVLQRGGDRFALTLRTFPDRPELPLLATALQAQWKAVGVDLKVAVGNSSEIPAGHQDGTLQLGLYARNYALVPDPLVTLMGDLAPGGSDWGVMNWQSAALTSQLARLGRDKLPTDEAAALRLNIATSLQQELPLLPIAWYRQSAAVSRDLKGFELDPQERSYYLTRLSWGRP